MSLLKKIIISLVSILFFSLCLLACKHEHHGEGHEHKSHEHKKSHSHDNPEHKKGHHHHEKGHGHAHANEHMNQTSFEDLVQRFDSPERDAYQQPDKVLAYIGEVKGKKILDIGAGTGYFSFKLAAKGADVIAGDVDDRFQNYIQEKIEKEDAPKVTLRKLPYDSPALAEKEVDKVLIVNTYHHIEDRVAYFGKVLKGLKDGGELLVIDFKKQDGPGPPVAMKMTADFITKELKQAGFTEFEVNDSLLENQYIIRAKKEVRNQTEK